MWRGRGFRGNLARGLGWLLRHVAGGLSWGRVGDLLHWLRLSDLLTAEPPVVFIRVVPVVEAPFRRGFAFSHMGMLSLSRKGVWTWTVGTIRM